MKKRVFIVHGWDGYPEEGWFPWLKKELEQKDFTVFVPKLPDAGNPRINNWVSKLTEVVGTVDENTYFVGHSMGCQTIARFLESLPENTKVGGAIFVAGFFKRLTGIDGEQEQKIVKHWLETSLDLAKVKRSLSNIQSAEPRTDPLSGTGARVKTHLPKSVAIFSDNDPFVPLDNQNDFKEKLGAKIIVEYNMGHFSGSTGTTELPVVLNSLLEISK